MKRSETIERLAAAILGVRLNHPTRVAIDGVDGVGKTTLADELVQPIQRTGRGVIRASIDGFHNPREVRHRRGVTSAEGYFLDSFDYPVLISELLGPLGPGGSRRFRSAVFDYRTDSVVEMPLRTANADDVLLFDGVFLHRSELRQHWDLKVWVQAPLEVAVERAIKRDARSGLDTAAIRARYEGRYLPGQRMYMHACRPAELADVVFVNTEPSRPTLRHREGGR